jgi:phage gp46-like protein
MDIETFITTTATGTSCDFGVAGGSLSAEHDIKTAVLISLFTDRRAEADDALPNPGGSLRGWWGDAFADRRIGSRLWLLGREKQLREVVNRAREYAEEALAWLVQDQVASRVLVAAYIAAPGWLALEIVVERQTAAPAKFKFDYAWAGAREVTH